ncbi:MAG TPA: transporter substrate-binding domain-containing protein [Stellaceae bacterium]|nr:transporter substrate-binding domain-containing protein [Stellaceae bacterium]
MRRLITALVIAVAALASSHPADAQDDSLAAIKARGKLIAGVKFDTPPFGFLDEKNEPVGFDIDLVRAIGRQIGVPVDLVAVTSPTRIPMLASGNVDLVAASMTRTPEREQAIDFSITYYTGGQSLLVPASSKIRGVEDLAGKPVAVQQGTTLEKNLAAAAPKAEIVAFKDYNSAWLALRQGRVDALTGSLNVLQGFAKDNRDFKIAGAPFSVEPFGIGVRKGATSLRDAVNATIRDLWTSGTYTELYHKWFGSHPVVPIETAPK